MKFALLATALTSVFNVAAHAGTCLLRDPEEAVITDGLNLQITERDVLQLEYGGVFNDVKTPAEANAILKSNYLKCRGRQGVFRYYSCGAMTCETSP